MTSIEYAYTGRNEWKGFAGSELVAWIFQDYISPTQAIFKPQIKTARGVVFGPPFYALETAKAWAKNHLQHLEGTSK